MEGRKEGGREGRMEGREGTILIFIYTHGERHQMDQSCDKQKLYNESRWIETSYIH